MPEPAKHREAEADSPSFPSHGTETTRSSSKENGPTALSSSEKYGPATSSLESPRLELTQDITGFAKELKAPPFVAALLIDRGISGKEEARRFFLAENPPEESAAGGLKGMTEAVDLLLKVRESGERLLVHGDYDVDGISGTALLYHGLKNCGFQVEWYLPNRFVDGYGLTLANVERFAKEGLRYIITVDTGTNAVEEIARARELGMHVLVADHHQPGEEMPPADVILNPSQPGCPYPNKQLCGTGVAYKLLSEIKAALGTDSAEPYLVYVALASLADMVPMRGENRNLTRRGLRLLRETTAPGLRMLLERTGLSRLSLSSADVLFKITPMLNAAGRMSTPETAFRLLSTDDSTEASRLMNQLEDLNGQRRDLDRQATEAAMQYVDELHPEEEDSCFVTASEDWHEGVIGIVAAKLVDRYSRPAFVLSISNGFAKGSGRTVTGFHLHKALASCRHLLEKWGGHYYACGFTIKTENIPEFRTAMQRLALEYLTPASRIRKVQPDAYVSLSDVNASALLWLQRFEPTGPDNLKPLLYTERVFVHGEPRRVGETHLKCAVSDGEVVLDVIGFGLGHLRDKLNWGKFLKMAFYPEWNFFQNKKTLQLRVVALEEMD